MVNAKRQQNKKGENEGRDAKEGERRQKNITFLLFMSPPCLYYSQKDHA
jgi:hypothetical protein